MTGMRQRSSRQVLARPEADACPELASNPLSRLTASAFVHMAPNVAQVDAAELPEPLRSIVPYDGSTHTCLTLQLMALTVVRTSVLIGARWQEFDFAAREWPIPTARPSWR